MGNGEDVLVVGRDVEGDKRCTVEGDLGITVDVVEILCMVLLCDIMVVLIGLTFKLDRDLTGFGVLVPICVWLVLRETSTVVVTIFVEPEPIQTEDVVWLGIGIRETLACV